MGANESGKELVGPHLVSAVMHVDVILVSVACLSLQKILAGHHRSRSLNISLVQGFRHSEINTSDV